MIPSDITCSVTRSASDAYKFCISQIIACLKRDSSVTMYGRLKALSRTCLLRTANAFSAHSLVSLSSSQTLLLSHKEEMFPLNSRTSSCMEYDPIISLLDMDILVEVSASVLRFLEDREPAVVRESVL
jgi:hypothetical protein